MPYIDFIDSVISGHPVVPQVIASDDFNSGTFSGGVGWNGAWSTRGDIQIRTNQDGPYSAPSHVRLRAGSGYMERAADLTGRTGVHLQFWAR